MYHRMLVLLDGSELAEIVFKYAQEISARMRMEIELLHVVSPHEAEQLPMRRAYIEHQAAELCAKAEAIRRKYDPHATEQCIQAHGNVAVGYPAEEILKWVDEHDIDLVMMSTHGTSGEKGWHLGSVANKVVHASNVPVWLVPTELREDIVADTLPGRHCVIPLSGSKLAEAVIPYAVSIIKQRGAEESEIVLLHVSEVEQIVVSRAALEEREQGRKAMQAYLEAKAEEIRQQGVPVRTALLIGDPAETIINYLRDDPAQLLAMATRGHGTLSRMIFGNVAETVLHLVKKTPLLLVSAEID